MKAKLHSLVKKDALDIVDYEALVNRIFEKKPTKPIVIFVVMPAVEKVLKKVGTFI